MNNELKRHVLISGPSLSVAAFTNKLERDQCHAHVPIPATRPLGAAPSGEVSMPTTAVHGNDPMSLDLGGSTTRHDSGDGAGSPPPEDGAGVVRNIVLFEGPADDVQQAVAELQLQFPGATLEPTDETARHRQLFVKETDGLPATVPADAITLAVRFETAPPRTPTSISDALQAVKAITDRWRKTLTAGYVYFDTRLVASALAMVYCPGPNSGDRSRGLIGSPGGHRQAYFRLKRHLYDDDNTFFRDVVTDAAEAQTQYPYRQEWDEECSPLRIQFLSEDPARQGWGLANGSDFARSQGDFLVKDGFLPLVGLSITTRTNWIDALTLMVHATHRGVYSFFDPDGQMMISGYALRAAGVIGPDLKPTRELSETDRRQYRLGNEPSEEQAMVAFLQIYAEALENALAHYRGQGGSSELADRLRRHRSGALCWLLQHVDSLDTSGSERSWKP